MGNITAPQAAKLLGISTADLRVLEKQGLIHPISDSEGVSFYPSEAIDRIKTRHGSTLSDEAAQVSFGIQRDIVSSLSLTKKVLFFIGGVVTGYAVLVVVLATMFVFRPLATAEWLGIARPSDAVLIGAAQGNQKVLGTSTFLEAREITPLQTILQPIGRVSLNLVKSLSPASYKQVAQVTILDPNDILTLDSRGVVIPDLPLSIADSSLLQIGSSELVENLNTQYLQGLQPGDQIGDIAIVQPATDTLNDVAERGSLSTVPVTLASSNNIITAGALTANSGSLNGVSIGAAEPGPGFFSTINGLVVTNNGNNTLSIANGKSFLVNNSMVFDGTDDTTLTFPTSSDTLVGRNSSDTLSNKTLSSPTLNGTITTTGLNFPGFTLSGNITGSGQPALVNFGAVNGLTLTPNVMGFSLAGGTTSKTITVNNSLSLFGIDGTTLTFQGSDTYVGRATTDTLSNKTIAASSNTITGLTNANLSGAAGISNANLANSTLTTIGNTGTGLVTLGGSLTFTGSGTTTVAAAGTSLTFTTTEIDTLQTVYGRGNTITTTGNGIVIDSSAATVVGTVAGLTITAPTTTPGPGIYNSLQLGTSTGSTANSYDQATIAVGNQASTDQQNFATLNITNGGSGFLDVELIRGFINFQGMNTLYEDFTSKSLDTADRWTSTATGTGSSCTILAGGLNGLFRMDTGPGINRGCELTTQAVGTLEDGYYQRGNNPIVETKLKIDTVTNARIFVGFTNTRLAPTAETNPSTHHAYIAKRAADTNWQCITDDGGATETITDTGVTISPNTFYRMRVELRNGTTPETICTVDDGIAISRTVVTTTQPGVTSPMDIYLKLNQSDIVNKNMDIDYVRAWQDDPPLVLIDVGDQPVVTELTELAEHTEATEKTEGTEETAETAETVGLLEQLGDTTQRIFKSLTEFFETVIFYADVKFLGRPVFNKDTAGLAIIRAGQSEVSVTFEKSYSQQPVVTASLNLVGSLTPDQAPSYAVYDVTTQGFKIKLSGVTASDLAFSWIALSVTEELPVVEEATFGTDSHEQSDNNSPTVTPSPTPVPPVQPATGEEALTVEILQQDVSPNPSPSSSPLESPSPTPESTPLVSPPAEPLLSE